MIRVFCAMCTVVSEVDGAAIPRKCPNCERRGHMTLARRTEVVEVDRSVPLETWLTFPQMEWKDEYRRRAREGLEQLVPRTEAQHRIARDEDALAARSR